jgi:VCBS repeat-containing protein
VSNPDNAPIETAVGESNEAPTAKDDAGNGFVTDEDNALFTRNVLENDSDPENDFLEVTLDSSNTVGTVTEQGNGNFIYDPNNEFESLDVGETATDTFNYTINDFHGGEDTGKVTIKIYGVNDAPTANDDAGNGFVTDEDNALFTGNVLENDSDPENDFLEVTLDSSNTVGTVTEQGNGNFIYDPNNEFESLDVGETATDTFNYTINDFDGGEDTGKVSVKIYGVNEEDSVAGLSNDDDLIQSQTQTSASGATSVSMANQVDGDNRDVTPELSDNLYSLGSVADSQEVPESFTPAIPFPTEGANDQGLDIA